MKHIFSFFACLCLFCLLVKPALAVVNTPTPTPTTSPKNTIEPSKSTDILNDLKDRIASRVAELNLVERRGIIGVVTNSTDTQITLIDKKGDTRFVDVDELTKFSSPSAKDSFGISDITKGSHLDVLGLYNKQSKRLLARFVTVITESVIVPGVVESVNKDDFSVKVLSEDGKTTTIDIENITRTQLYTKADGLTKVGFSKILPDTRIIVIGYKNIKIPDRVTATRVLLFPDLPKNPKINLPQQALSPQETIIPSTGSGKKLTPITH